MCGIGGVWCFRGERLTREDAERIKELAVYLEDRGTDAFGFYNGEKVIKFPSRASQVITQIENIKPFYKLVKGRKMFLMHTRLATVGDPLDNKNNHPFETKDFVLAHNGSVYKYKKYVTEYRKYVQERLEKKKKGKYKDEYETEIIDMEEIFGNKYAEIPETDSFMIAVELQKLFNEIEEVVTAFAKTMRYMYSIGQYALWVYSKKDNVLLLYRDSNPLFIGFDENKLWFASEEWMLKGIGIDNVIPVDAGDVRIYDENGLVEVVEVVRYAKVYNDDIDYGYVYDYRELKFEECKNYCKEYEDCKAFYEEYGVRFCDSYYHSHYRYL